MKRYRVSAFAIGYLLLAIVVSGCGPSTATDPEIAARLPDIVDYNFHVKPILSDRCYSCHGPDGNSRKAGLRLDIEDVAKSKLESGGRAIVDGSTTRSKLVSRILSHDPEFYMPPPVSNLVLSDYEKAVIVKWIDQGAKWKPHWAFLPVNHSVPPSTTIDSLVSWPLNEIDQFVLARLESERLRPSEQADRERLIRRVSFDLTGLPPTIREIDSFLDDDSDDAFERVVDRLLASASYGEHMAAEWLDVARYADSHGYQDDGLRNMWPWRDWVIGAFNKNMPYDEFLTVQLAGDLLPDRTRDQLLATGFNRNHLQSQEGGIVPEEYRVDYVADRTNTLGRSVLGLTVECSRCHDHKFDPITQKEYFEMFAFFNNVNEFGNIPYAGEASPTVILTTDAAEDSLVGINARITELEALVDIRNGRFDTGYSKWLAHNSETPLKPVGRVAYFPLDEIVGRTSTNVDDSDNPAGLYGDADKDTRTVPGRIGNGQKLVGDTFIQADKEVGFFERNQPFSISLWLNIETDKPDGPLFNKAGGLFNGMRGYAAMFSPDGKLTVSLNHVFPANSISLETIEPLRTYEFQHLVMTYDGSSRASGLRLFVDGSLYRTRVTADNLQMSILYQIDPRDGKRSNWGDPGRLRIGWMEPNTAKLDSVVVDEFKVFDRELTAGEVAVLARADTDSDVDVDAAGVTRDADLRAYYVTTVDPDYRKDFRELTEVRGQQNEIMTRQQETMVMEELPEPRQTFVLNRGAYDAPTEPVEANAPAWLYEYDTTLEKNRLGLAKWLTDPKHPLTSRVAVNRLWQRFFGFGIVATPDDFGNQGARPTHPELLDWLATEFVESGWDVKAMQKRIVTSATYQQSSIADDELRHRDPDNALLARGPSRRLSAEMIRDNALASSGLLVSKIGGPSVKPYQPAGLWEELATRNATVYVPDTGEGLYRRSLYTIWKRTTPPPSMVSFDAADRNVCTVKRQSTSTPMQALVLLNDPQYVESSRVLAERVLRDGGGTAASQVILAFRLLTSRRPRAEELTVLVDLFQGQRADFVVDRAAARELLAVGDSERDEALPVETVAAMTVVASTIMSFDEAVTLR